jgi:hypothetical protein
MRIYLVDQKRHIEISTQEGERLLKSGLSPENYTRENIEKFLTY